MSIWRSKERNVNHASHANALFGCVCFVTYDDQVIQMVFSFHFMQLHFLDVIKTNRKLHFSNGDLLLRCRKQQLNAQNIYK